MLSRKAGAQQPLSLPQPDTSIRLPPLILTKSSIRPIASRHAPHILFVDFPSLPGLGCWANHCFTGHAGSRSSRAGQQHQPQTAAGPCDRPIQVRKGGEPDDAPIIEPLAGDKKSCPPHPCHLQHDRMHLSRRPLLRRPFPKYVQPCEQDKVHDWAMPSVSVGLDEAKSATSASKTLKPPFSFIITHG